MDAIGIIIFIVVAVIQAVSKMSGRKERLPRQWEPPKLPRQEKADKRPGRGWDTSGLPPILRDWEFPWDDSRWDDSQWKDTSPDEKGTSPNEKAASYKERAAMIEKPQSEKLGESVIAGSEPFLPDPAVKAAVSAEPGSDACIPALSLGSGDILNGLILSELLQPPKSRRKR